MVGTRGKGKASSAKPKGKAPSVVSAVTKPVIVEESSQCPSAGENKIGIPSTVAKENDDQILKIPSTDEKKNDDATPGVVGNGTEDNQQLANEGNDDEKSNVEENDHENSDDEQNDDENDVTDEMTSNEVDNLSEEPEEDNDDDEEEEDDDDAANDVDPENNGVDKEEDVEEDLSDDGGAVNNVDDGEDIEGKPDEEVEMEDKELINDCGGDENILTGEENKDTEMAEDGKMVTDEGLAVSEHGLADEMMNKEASVEPNTEGLLSTPVGGERENMSIASDVKAPTEEAKKPKKKIIKKVIKRVRKKPQSAVVNDASGNGESAETNKNVSNGEKAEINDASGNGESAETNKNESNEAKAEIKQPVVANKKLNRKRKLGVSETNVGVAASSDGQKAEPSNIEQGTEVVKETDKVEVEGEKVGKLGNKARRLRRKRKQKMKKDETTANETTVNVVVTGDTNKAGPSQKGKPKKADSMGMIFMCSSETKKDCYNYKVLGLPANKKDFVSNIYQGMRLFLFDVQLRMLYGIYKAAAPGGFNIEPRAFKSKYPSQVRFTVLEECVPLSEEKFKKVIKKNYYAKNKFNCKLSSMQVRDLCKLFREATKAESTRTVRNPVEAAPSSAQRDNKKKRKRMNEGPKARPAPPSKRDRRHTTNRGDARRGPPPVAAADRYYQRSHPVVYEREAYLPPRAPPVQVVYQPLPPPSLPRPSSYSYGGAPRDDIYRHEPALERVPVIERRELSLRGPTEADRREPYSSSYRDTRGAYLEPAYETGIRRDLFESSGRRDVYEPSARREHYDYTSDGRRVEYYSSAEYRAPLPPYRRY